MAERDVFRLFKGPTKKEFCSALDKVTKKYGGRVGWDEPKVEPRGYIGVAHNKEVHTVLMDFLDGVDGWLCHYVGIELDCPWIEVRVQEGDHWDYALNTPDRTVDDFSTRPEYWDDDKKWQKTKKGDAAVLAKIWKIAEKDISRYVVWWRDVTIQYGGMLDMEPIGPNAYPDDEHSYGDIWQCLDFMKKLGGQPDDMENITYHRLDLPTFPELEKRI